MKNFSLRAKLYWLGGTLSFFLIIVGVTGYWALDKVSTEYSKVAKISFPNTKNILEGVTHFRLARIELLHLMSPGMTPTENQASLKSIESSWNQFTEADKAYLAVDFCPGEEAIYKEYKTNVDLVKKDFDKSLALYKKNSDEKSTERVEILKLF